jgi:hypothetical protein
MNSVFHALGDITRRRMQREFAVGKRTVSQSSTVIPGINPDCGTHR